MGIDTYVELSSLLSKLIECSSAISGTSLDLESYAGSKAVSVESSVYAEEISEKLRYEETIPVTKIVGSKYQMIKPPKQRV